MDVLQMLHINIIIKQGGNDMNKSISMSVRVNKDELEIIKEAARLERYSSYSEFIRRTALLEATKIIEEKSIKEPEKLGKEYMG